MLQISHVVKSFEKIKAVKDVSLNIEKGEFFGLLGPNGAGKTTLMNLIIGYLEPDGGHIAVDDEAMVTENIEMRKRFGYVPQEIALYQELTAIQNLKIFGSVYNIPKSELNANINKALDLVKLYDRRNDDVKNFSGGMKRRLNLACSILHDPEIILCDEPTVGVDPQSRNAIFEMLKELNKAGKTLLYTTHYMEEAERMCTRMAIIDNGEIIAKGTLTELLNLLENKETIRILKSPATVNKQKVFEEIGLVNDTDFHFEILPGTKFKKLSEIFIKLESEEIPSEFISIKKATLEDLFLHLTGRSLRD